MGAGFRALTYTKPMSDKGYDNDYKVNPSQRYAASPYHLLHGSSHQR